jgi:hypothetical protein
MTEPEPIIWADISEYQKTLYTSDYAVDRDVLAIRAAHGNETDANVAENWRRIQPDLDSGALALLIVYVVYIPGTNDAVMARLGSVFGADPDPRLVWMVDVESGANYAGPGDHSVGANELCEKLVAWCGSPWRVIGYANGGDWENSWPTPPPWMDRATQQIIADYRGVQPIGDWMGWQYTNGQWPNQYGYPSSSPPFGACDHNVYTGAGGLAGMLAGFGIGETPVTTTWLPGAKVVDLRQTRGNGPFRNFLGVVLHVNVDENGTTDSFYAAGTSVNPSSVTPTSRSTSPPPANRFAADQRPVRGASISAVRLSAVVPGRRQRHLRGDRNGGSPTEPLTDYQLEQSRASSPSTTTSMGMPYRLANSDGAPRLRNPCDGGISWVGILAPGTIRTAQRQTILDIAQEGPMPTAQEIATEVWDHHKFRPPGQMRIGSERLPAAHSAQSTSSPRRSTRTRSTARRDRNRFPWR